MDYPVPVLNNVISSQHIFCVVVPNFLQRGILAIFGIGVALILQLFYSYILSKIEKLTGDMEESAIELLDAIQKYKNNA